jgi:predicted nucleotidyltransferase
MEPVGGCTVIREGRGLPEHVLDTVPKLVEELSKEQHLVAVYGFGGLASGRLGPLSDLDFGILLSTRLSTSERRGMFLDLLGLFNRILGTDEVDLIGMNDAPSCFSRRILEGGRLLLVRNERELADFWDQVTRYCLDFRFFKEEFDRAFEEGIGCHG